MSANLKQRLFTPEEYLAVERMAESRSEYLEGMISAMVGASSAHSMITFNVSVALGKQLHGKPCRGFSSDMKVQTSDERLYAYPDLTIACGKLHFRDENKDVLLNPKVIIEVLSPSTEDYDRSKKFALYKRIESLTDYLLIAQDRPTIDHYRKNEEGDWLLRDTYGLGASVQIASIECALPLAEVYDGVTFDRGIPASPESR
jgi:Uma2 family endonuclease